MNQNRCGRFFEEISVFVPEEHSVSNLPDTSCKVYVPLPCWTELPPSATCPHLFRPTFLQLITIPRSPLSQMSLSQCSLLPRPLCICSHMVSTSAVEVEARSQVLCSTAGYWHHPHINRQNLAVCSNAAALKFPQKVRIAPSKTPGVRFLI